MKETLSKGEVHICLETQPRRSGEIVVLSVNGEVAYHPEGTQVWGSDGLMGGYIEFVAEDDYFTYYIDEEGRPGLKNLDINFFIQFERVAAGSTYGYGFPFGKVVMVPTEQERMR